MADDTDDRIRRIEYAIWGLRGDNGMVSDVRALRQEFAAYVEAERVRREKEAQTRARAMDLTRSEKRRNFLTGLGITVTGLGSLTTAILMIINQA